VSAAGKSTEWKLLTLSARSAESMRHACLNLAGWLRANERIDLADVAYTLQTGRRRFRFRRAILCRDGREAVRLLEDFRTMPFEAQREDPPAVSFTFDALDGDLSCTVEAMLANDLPCNDALRACLGRGEVEPEQVVDGAENRASTPLVVQYAAARCLMDWGVLPATISGAGAGDRLGRALAEALLSDDACRRVSIGLGGPSELVAPDDEAAPPGGGEPLLVRFGGGSQSAEPNTIIVDVAEIARKPAEALRRIVGRLWEAGVDIDWRKFDSGETRKRVPLPTYPFEHKRYWIGRQPLEAGAARAVATEVSAPAAPRPPLAVPYVAPTSDVQRAIRDVWARVLGIRGIGIDDNFFDLGGDSLLAVSVAERITGALGTSVPAVALYEGTSIRLLAELLENEASTSEAAAQPR
jgi:acyl transferase domain-containing protein